MQKFEITKNIAVFKYFIHKNSIIVKNLLFLKYQHLVFVYSFYIALNISKLKKISKL